MRFERACARGPSHAFSRSILRRSSAGSLPKVHASPMTVAETTEAPVLPRAVEDLVGDISAAVEAEERRGEVRVGGGRGAAARQVGAAARVQPRRRLHLPAKALLPRGPPAGDQRRGAEPGEPVTHAQQGAAARGRPASWRTAPAPDAAARPSPLACRLRRPSGGRWPRAASRPLSPSCTLATHTMCGRQGCSRHGCLRRKASGRFVAPPHAPCCSAALLLPLLHCCCSGPSAAAPVLRTRCSRSLRPRPPPPQVRNLVAATDAFELLVLCWRPGQGSRVHNHERSHGLVTPLRGRVEEIRCVGGQVGCGERLQGGEGSKRPGAPARRQQPPAPRCPPLQLRQPAGGPR